MQRWLTTSPRPNCPKCGALMAPRSCNQEYGDPRGSQWFCAKPRIVEHHESPQPQHRAKASILLGNKLAIPIRRNLRASRARPSRAIVMFPIRFQLFFLIAFSCLPFNQRKHTYLRCKCTLDLSATRLHVTVMVVHWTLPFVVVLVFCCLLNSLGVV